MYIDTRPTTSCAVKGPSQKPQNQMRKLGLKVLSSLFATSFSRTWYRWPDVPFKLSRGEAELPKTCSWGRNWRLLQGGMCGHQLIPNQGSSSLRRRSAQLTFKKKWPLIPISTFPVTREYLEVVLDLSILLQSRNNKQLYTFMFSIGKVFRKLCLFRQNKAKVISWTQVS